MKAKRVWGLALAAMLALGSFAGCGSSKKADSDVFRIGSIGPLTGDAASYGEAVKKGAELAVKEVNKDGGINGKKVEFKMEDDEADAEKAVNAYNTLKDWGMQMLAGTTTSASCIAVQAVAKEDNMFLLAPSATAVEAIEGDNAFRVCFSDPAQGTKSAQYMAEHKLAKKVAVIYDSSDPYSSGIYKNFKEEAKKQNIEIASAEAFTKDSKTDFSVQLSKAKDSGADLLFLPIYYQAASLILKQADDMGYKPTIFGCDGLDGLLNVENFDTSLAEGAMLLTPFAADAQDEKTEDFVTAYKKAYDNQTPIQFAADAYDAVFAIKLASEDSKITPDMSVSDICDKLKTSMTKIKLEGTTGTITWDKNGEPDKEPKAVVIENGAYKAM